MTYKKMLKQAFPLAEFPKNFMPLFPNKVLLPRDAWEMAGGEKEFDRLRREYPDIIRTYPRGAKGTATKFLLWEVQDAILQQARDFRAQLKKS